jgi:hypothetical protein
MRHGRFMARDSRERRAEAQDAVAHLLAAAAGTRGGGSGGARTGNRGGPAETSAAVQRLHEMYSALQPPPLSVLRHPQARRGRR